MIDIKTNIAEINAQIQRLIAEKSEPVTVVRLVAVSKKQPVSAILQAAAAGQRDFGENYLQEAVEKINEIDDKSLIWHFIGAIQSNKTAAIAENFQWVHTVDRLKIARRLSDQRPTRLEDLNVCLQVNIDADPAKAGVDPGQCRELALAVRELPRLRLRGLMTITAVDKTPAESERSFAAMRELFLSLQAELGESEFDTLSMGMSRDWPLALAQGATMLRIGSAIFGPRG